MARVEGVETVLRNINRELNDIKGKTIAGLWEAGLQVEREAKLKAPVDTGNLKGSGYTRRMSDGVEVGFTAKYAAWVHEMVDQKLKGNRRPSGGNYWEVGEPKFLEKALREVDIVGIVQRKARVR